MSEPHDGSDLVIVTPVWRRTTNLARVLTSALDTVPAAHFLFVASVEDRVVIDALDDLLDVDYLLLPGAGGGQGDYARKINAGYQATTEPFIFTAADDLRYTPGWYHAARALTVCPHGDETCPCQDGDVCHYEGEQPFACPTTRAVGCVECRRVGVVGTVDDTNPRTIAGEHSTHSLVARWYADCCAVSDQPGAIYHEGYYHEFCDDELVRTAIHRGAYGHAFDAHVEHLHPMGNKAPDDETYRRGRSKSMLSRKLFSDRAPLWGDQPRYQRRQVFAKRPGVAKQRKMP